MQTRVLRDQADWPLVVDMDLGAKYLVRRSFNGATIERELLLLEVEEVWEPDYWIENNPERRTLAGARITVEVDGKRGVVRLRPYQSPAVVNGLRLYAETTRICAGGIIPLDNFDNDVRFSICAEEEPWGPQDILFPLLNYRWRASSYNNTWNSLVPHNTFYYHRGEDWGAVPDKLPVIAAWSGEVVQTPVPDGDQQSNRVAIENKEGAKFLYSHMNLETINPALVLGHQAKAGEQTGLTGMTWSGKRCQHSDPHLHVGFYYRDTYVSTFPFLTQAYFRMYPDTLLALAGGYLFTTVDGEVELDGSRSLARPGRSIAEYLWRLHDGREVAGPLAKVSYDRPGLFSEELIVRADDGSEDRDYAQVRVYDPEQGRNISYGWTYHTPVRGITPGQPVLFWNRLIHPQGEVLIDFGDGSAPQNMTGLKELTHAYDRAGYYTVSLSARDIRLKMRVVVEL